MKILFTCLKVVSHFKPLLPFAEALKARGHDVRFAAIAELADEINGAGFEHLIQVGPSDETRKKFGERFVNVSAKEASKLYVPEFFMNVLAKTALPGLIKSLEVWRPDLIVREPTEFSGIVAAQKLGIRHVRLEIVNGESEEAIATKYHKEFDELRSSVSLPPLGPGCLKDEMSFSAHPQALDNTPRINTKSPIRFLANPLHLSGEVPDADWMPQDDLPMIYATFGTVAAGIDNANDIFRIALEAFADLPAKILLTTGKDAPADLISSVPSNVIIRAFVPQEDVLPHARLMVCHGGSGTVIAGLASGVPMVITPLFADQPDNANCLEAAGLCLSVPDADVASLRNAVVHALGDDGMRERAQMAAKEIAKMATVDEAVDLMLSA